MTGGAGQHRVRRGRVARAWLAVVPLTIAGAGITVPLALASSPASAASTGSSVPTVSTAAALESAFAAGGIVTLAGDVPDAKDLKVPANGAVMLDLAGHALTVGGDNSKNLPAIEVDPGSALTIEDSSSTPGSSALTGTGSLKATGGTQAAAIGGGFGGGAGSVTIIGGTVTATAVSSAAGIGGGSGGAGGSVTVSGGSVTAIGGSGDGAGIGGGPGPGGDGGSLTVTGGSVSARGGQFAPGIGAGGLGGAAGSLSVTGGSVAAFGGPDAAAIGGGDGSPADSVTVSGGSVTATAGANAPAIGGGYNTPGGSVAITGGVVTVAAGPGVSAIGAGSGISGFGSLSNAGTLTIASGTLTVPSGTTVANTGTILGSVVNNGTITGNDYALSFNDGSGATPKTVDVYAPSLSAATESQAVPTPSDPTQVFAGWFTTSAVGSTAAGFPVTNGTLLQPFFGQADSTGPVKVALKAAYAVPVSDSTALVTAFNAGGIVALGQDFPTPVQGLIAPSSGVVLDLNGYQLAAAGQGNDLDAGVGVGSNASLIVEDTSGAGTGTLTATGVNSGAGIGGEDNHAPGAAASGTVIVTSGSVVATGGNGAGIGGVSSGGGYGGAAVVTGGSVTATSGDGGAGIGSGASTPAQNTVTVTGGSVTASGGSAGGGAGIGGGNGSLGGTVVVWGGTVAATGGAGGGAGIGGGGGGGAGGTLTVHGGAVTATGGGNGAAGIGGGISSGGAGGTVSVTGGSVTATGTGAGAGIGGGNISSGGTVTLAGGSVIAGSKGGGEPIGYGTGFISGSTFGSLSIGVGASLTVATGSTLTVPDGVTVQNDGSIAGAVQLGGSGEITNNAFSLSLNGNDGSASTALTVYADTVAGSGQSLGTPSGDGTPFLGWFDGGTQVTDSTDLQALLGKGPLSATLNAGYQQVTVTTAAEVTAAFAIPGQTVVLGQDIADTAEYVDVPNGGAITLDLAGQSLATAAADEEQPGIQVNSGAGLIIEDTSATTADPGAGSLTAQGKSYGAGIGGAYDASGGSVSITGGTIRANGGGDSAGIGGGLAGDGGVVTITGGAVTANGAGRGAGIGGANGGAGGSVTITGGTVAATGGSGAANGAAGIGGANGGAGGAVTITGGDVTAQGGFTGAGIGGGSSGGLGGPVSITGGTVQATGGDHAAGIGGGGGSTFIYDSFSGGGGGAVSIAAGAVTVTAGSDGGTAIGAGWLGTGFGSLSLGSGGLLTIASGSTLEIPSGVTVPNGGTILGAVQVDSGGVITGNAYTAGYDANGGSGAPSGPGTFYAPSLFAAGLSLEAGPSGLAPGATAFSGWSPSASGGELMSQKTDLPSTVGSATSSDSPLPVTFFAQYDQGGQQITFPAIAAKTLGTSDFDPDAAATSGLPVSYDTSTTSTVCSIVSGKVHLLGTGQCTVTASQAGTSGWSAAQSVPQSFQVNSAVVTVPQVLQVSGAADRSSSQNLDGDQTVSGNVFVFANVPTNDREVLFSLDGNVFHDEATYPFDFNGTAVGNLATPFSTSSLADGPHTISARLTSSTGVISTVSANFTVANNAPVVNQVLQISSAATRSPSQNLDGDQTVSGPMYVFANVPAADREVVFSLDGSPFHTEASAPFDFNGTATATTAYAYPSTSLANGVHTISVTVLDAKGNSSSSLATFAVNNGGTVAPPPAMSPLRVSTSADRSNPVNLNGASLTGAVYIFDVPTSAAYSVVFSLDGKAFHTESTAPYDFNGSGPSNALPYSLSGLTKGKHTITAVTALTNGKTETTTSTFTVS